MYNSSNHDVYKIALEMYKEVMNNVEVSIWIGFIIKRD
jgi:hypothetical protein